MVHRKSWGHIVAIVILGLAVMCVPARSQQFSTPKNVSNNSDFSFTPQLAVDLGGNIYVVWEDDTDTNSNILFSRSTDGGVTFSAAKSISNTSGSSFNPRIAVDAGGSINVVWQDSPDFFQTSNVFFSRSTDGGLTFSSPIDLSASMTSAFYSMPQIAVHTANISVVWESDTGNLAVWFSGSSDGGATFSAPKMLSTNTGGSIDPQIAMGKNGAINVVWEDDTAGHSDISFSRSADNGANFSLPKNLSNPLGNALANSNSPRLAVDLAGNLNVVWANDSPGNFEIFLSRSTDGGVNFSGPKNISNSSGFSSLPVIALDAGGSINVVWADINPVDSNTDIYFARSSDGGATFSAAQNLSNNSGFSSTPWLTVDAGANINVAWEDNTPGNRDIFFSRSTDSGATFSATPVNLSSAPGLSLAVQIAADKNGNINVAWQDHSLGISQIFFSRLPADAGASQPPTIVTPPANQTVTAGLTATFSVTASGTAPLSYQWQKDGVDINGATLASYTTPATTTQDNAAQFRVVVSNSVGTATSSVATLTVNAPPSITSQPANQTVTLGQMATFSVTASGTAPLSYQWQKDGVDINGATLASYTTPTTTAQDNGAQFRVVVSNSVGTATSSVATLTVNAPPSITSQPANQTVTLGQMATFSVTASGTAPLSYQWQKGGVDISGATLASYITPAATTQDNAAQFRVVVSNSVGTATSSVATLTVNAPPQCSPTLRVSLSPNTLWSPNHKLVQITASVEASDSCDANPAVSLASIASNEPDNGAGDGDQPNDIQAVGGGPIPFGTDVRSFLLRAERSGMGSGRVYTVNYMLRDASGNQSLASAQVSVGSQATDESSNRSTRKKK